MLLVLPQTHATVVLTETTKKVDNFTLQYFYDNDSLLDIRDIQNIKFSETIPSQFTQGYRYGNAWFKIEVENRSRTEEFVLYFTESIWSTLDLYVGQDGTWKVQKNGLNVPLGERCIQDSSPAFKLHIPVGQSATLFIKGQTIASQIGEFQIYTQEEYYNPSRITLSEWYTIYAFILFSFVLLNLYNFAMTREAIYVYYIIYVLVYIVFSFMHSGVYIAFGFPNWQEGLHTLGQLTLLTLLLFSVEFLELRRTYPLMEKVFYRLAFIAFVFAMLLSQNVPYSTAASNIFFSGVLITIVYVAVVVLRRGFSGAKYYLIALMLYLPSMAMMAMNFNTLLPNTDVTRYSFLGGAFLEIFLFTLILTNRYKYISELNELLVTKTSELEETKAELLKESTTDFLSTLHNRRYFVKLSEQQFKTAQKHHRNLSILMIDIDRFKKINDTYGHAFGDHVICVVASIIKSNLRTSDIAARYGGEEFVVLLLETGLNEAADIAERIRNSVENQSIKRSESSTYSVTVSIGISELECHQDRNIEEVISRADKAMYAAKQSGKNAIFTAHR